MVRSRTAEVFGLFVDAEYKDSGVGSALLQEMLVRLYDEFGALQEIVYFIEEDNAEELNVALAEGFEIKDGYRCYRCML
ncbi:MAG TPA: hypothetical protein DDW87_14830 [Firmicutes bacterium]|nr:hypothetical protein [Bacillota bacterium]